MKKIIGITGGIGAGKSVVSDLFAKLGATIVDADKIAREILEPMGRAFVDVVETFGTEIVKKDGTLDRKKLAGIVFGDSEKLQTLNRLTHPAVYEEMRKQIESAEAKVVCLDVPLLFTCDFPISCDVTLAVIASDEVRVNRVMKRDGCTKEEAEMRMKKQLSNEEFQKRADICLWNNGTIDDIKEKVLEIYYDIMEK